jgi:hypothetical protein
MRPACHQRKGKRGSVLMLYTLAVGLVILPLVGLAIDFGVLYTVQARLWAAVDGASLGAGRLLGTSADPAQVAGQFLQATFPAGYWHTPTLTNVTPPDCGTDFYSMSIPHNSYSARHCVPTIGSHVVDVTASVQVPLYFLRILGATQATVSAHAQATRRDTRVVLVLDHSGSMTTTGPGGEPPAWPKLQLAARDNFAKRFRPGIDRLGLVVFGTSAIVAYPSNYPRPYNPLPGSGGGPNTSFIDSTDVLLDGSEFHGTGDMLYMIMHTAPGGATGMAEALWLAYIELQKGHMTDLADGPDGRLNAIVLFTDGYPNQIPVYLNSPSANMLRQPKCPAGHPATDCCNCTYNPASSADTTQQMVGVLGTPGYPTSTTMGNIYQSASYNTISTLNWVQATGGVNANGTTPISSSSLSNCKAMFTVVSPYIQYGDLQVIPTADMYGNSTRGTAYVNSQVAAASGTPDPFYRGTAMNVNNTNRGYDWALAVWNTVDAAGYNIRSDTGFTPANRPGDTTQLRPTIYTIGYLGGSGVDEGLLKRLANTVDAPPSGYHTANAAAGQTTGAYYAVFRGDDISGAFDQIAAEILRLAQ